MFDGFELAMIELPDARLRVRWVGQGRRAGIFIDHLHDADDRAAGRKLAITHLDPVIDAGRPRGQL